MLELQTAAIAMAMAMTPQTRDGMSSFSIPFFAVTLIDFSSHLDQINVN